MPDTSLPNLYLPDPNGFTNALAAGMKLRRYQQEGDAALRKEEQAEAQRNALSAYLLGGQSEDSLRALGAASPEAYLEIAKHKLETDKAKAQTTKATAEGDKAKLEAMLRKVELGGQILSGVRDEGSYQWAKARGPELDLDTSQWPAQYDPAFVEQSRMRGIKLKDQIDLQLRQESNQSLDEHRAASLAETVRHHDSLDADRDADRNKPQYITNDAGTFAISPQNPQAGAVPVPGIPGAGPSAVVREADKAWMKGQDEAGAAAEKLSNTIEQARGIISSKGGVLGSGPIDRAAYGLHQLGLNNSDAAVNTERLREIGAQMTLSFGSLGSQVSNADREVYARAQGNFENAKSLEAMKLSLDEMAAVAQKTIEKINSNRAAYQETGRKPDFAPAPPAVPPEAEERKAKAREALRRRGIIQ